MTIHSNPPILYCGFKLDKYIPLSRCKSITNSTIMNLFFSIYSLAISHSYWSPMIECCAYLKIENWDLLLNLFKVLVYTHQSVVQMTVVNTYCRPTLYMCTCYNVEFSSIFFSEYEIIYSCSIFFFTVNTTLHEISLPRTIFNQNI